MKKNSLDTQYTYLLQDILDNGYTKEDRTGTGTKSVFGRTIRHDMSEGFPLLTTKKVFYKAMVAELKWFLRGSTDIRELWKDNCNIWDGDWYKHYKTTCSEPYSLKEIKEKIQNPNHQFHDTMFSLGPIYGKQWREWSPVAGDINKGGNDQIQEIINTLKTNPDSRRMMVSAWNVGELYDMVLPPCHYGFQVYTRKLSYKERYDHWFSHNYETGMEYFLDNIPDFDNEYYEPTPERTISLKWDQRSVDVFLGLPFNIASYGLLLMLLAKEVNMIPEELIGNLGDVHLYNNHIEQAKEQIGKELTIDERFSDWFHNQKPNRDIVEYFDKCNPTAQHKFLDDRDIPKKSRESRELPTVRLKNVDILNGGFDYEIFDYEPHPSIKAPLSN